MRQTFFPSVINMQKIYRNGHERLVQIEATIRHPKEILTNELADQIAQYASGFSDDVPLRQLSHLRRRPADEMRPETWDEFLKGIVDEDVRSSILSVIGNASEADLFTVGDIRKLNRRSIHDIHRVREHSFFISRGAAFLLRAFQQSGEQTTEMD